MGRAQRRALHRHLARHRRERLHPLRRRPRRRGARGLRTARHPPRPATLSAVNVAEYSPLLSEATDAYLRADIDIAPKLGAGSIVVHAGYHFTADVRMRMEAGLERLKRMAAYAETKGTLLLLENLNKEPADAEVHYLAHTVEEWR